MKVVFVSYTNIYPYLRKSILAEKTPSQHMISVENLPVRRRAGLVPKR